MKITVLYLGKSGGGCVYTYEMVRYLLEQKAEIQLILSSLIENKSDFDNLNNKENLNLIFTPTYKNGKDFVLKSLNILKFIKIGNRIDSFSPDWIYIPMISIWARMILPFVNKKTKVITTIHDVSMHLGEKNSLIDRFNDYIIRHSHKIVTLSERFIPLISEKYVFNTKQICWIRHGNYNYYRPVNFQNKNSITKRILFFGRIHEYKGISVLLDAMTIIKEKDPDIVLNIVGKGKFSDSDNEKINWLGKSCNIVNKYIPNEEIYRYFEDIDFVVVPYIEASQSGVVMLAYSFSKPVIVTNVGGLPEQVFEDTGIIVQPNDKNALADSILKMYEEPQKIPEMGKFAEEKNETVFSWKTSAKKLLKFLETDF